MYLNLNYFIKISNNKAVPNFNKFLKFEYFILGIFIALLCCVFISKKRKHEHIPNSQISRWKSLLEFVNCLWILKMNQFFIWHSKENRDKDIYKIQLGFQEMVVVTNPDMIMQVCSMRPGSYIRPKSTTGALSTAHNVFASEADNWKTHRKTAGAFTMTQMSNLFQPINHIVDRFIRKLEQHLDNDNNNNNNNFGSEINVSQEMSGIALDVIHLVGLGHEFGISSEKVPIGKVSKFAKRIRVALPVITKRIMSPFPYWKVRPSWTDRQLDKFIQMIRDYRTAQQADQPEPASPFLKSLVEQLDANSINEDEIIANLAVYVLAGHDTITCTLSYTLHLLAMNQDILKKVRNEVDLVMNSLAVDGCDEPVITNKIASQFVYLQQVILETFRFKSLVPFIMLECNQDNIISSPACGNVEIYEGASICLSFESYYNNPKYFVKPEEFNPDRWKGVNIDNCQHFKLFPYSYGPRMCPGKRLSKVELVVILAKLIHRFDIQTSQNKMNHSYQDHYSFLQSPDPGIIINFKFREN
ncbi:cytochrome P450 [Cavenderia fasciculata]|uniref:Cytochrome P450 n=1 Tax=Cavenderia fasciculata TaxID=261658 RepID=F4Q1E9_CACFS|nr:cytochrome P450 [Cavenderia fasciculata]EGG18650.1 cytochrome P450 [Cavenderia fasciculata]|eukprot:XP_004366554.1 cytochrome P450 [Cavenderia fasciculata]